MRAKKKGPCWKSLKQAARANGAKSVQVDEDFMDHVLISIMFIILP